MQMDNQELPFRLDGEPPWPAVCTRASVAVMDGWCDGVLFCDAVEESSQCDSHPPSRTSLSKQHMHHCLQMLKWGCMTKQWFESVGVMKGQQRVCVCVCVKLRNPPHITHLSDYIRETTGVKNDHLCHTLLLFSIPSVVNKWEMEKVTEKGPKVSPRGSLKAWGPKNTRLI